jgi:O-antigen/teichoic acid export membrane protein
VTPGTVRVADGERGTDVVRGLMWSSMGVAAQGVGQLVLLAVLARLLLPADFGVVSASLIITGFVLMLTEGLIGPALTQRRELSDEHIRTASALSVMSGAAAMLATLALAPALADWFRMDDLTPIVRGLSVIFLIQGIAVVPLALLKRHFRFASLAKVELASFLLGYAAVGVILALLGAGAWALVGAHLAKSLVMTAALVRLQPHERSFRVDRVAARHLLSFGAHHTVAGMLNQAALQGDYVVVGRWLSASALGIYGRAYQLATVPGTLLGTVLDHVLFPKMASRQDDRTRLRHDFLVATSLTSTIVTPVLVLLVIVAPELVAVVLGDGWEAVVVPLRVLALGLVWRTAYKLSDSLAKAAGAVASRAWRQGVYATLVIGGAIVGTRWGLTGVSVAVLGAIFINYLLMSSLSLRIVNLSWGAFIVAHARGIVLAAIVGGIAQSVASALRALGSADLTVLAAATAPSAAVALLALLPSQAWVLGDDVRWLIHRVTVVIRETTGSSHGHE